ncbi:MAG: UDP-N-acetylmuramate dehydrogenase [Acidobacteria bacterium]|nr:UDP-N-acetylmuramate dehydrogenase [Acidobacteriota bacterium]
MLESLRSAFPSLTVQAGAALAHHTTFKIGGACRALVPVTDDGTLAELAGHLSEGRVPHIMIGGGSNLLFDSSGYEGIVVKNLVSWIRRSGDRIEASGGCDLQDLLRFSLDEGLAGLEFAAGIPGTFGGGLAGNAGAYGANLGEILESASILDDRGRAREVAREYFEFAYRRSRIQRTGEIILSARIRLSPCVNLAASRSRCDEILASREAKHPHAGMPSAGSFFKNLDRFDDSGKRIPAGLLLDKVGCKGLRIGNAQVYEKHANIIVNLGGATSSEVLTLAAEMRRRVLESFGVALEPEVRFVPRGREEQSEPNREMR